MAKKKKRASKKVASRKKKTVAKRKPAPRKKTRPVKKTAAKKKAAAKRPARKKAPVRKATSKKKPAAKKAPAKAPAKRAAKPAPKAKAKRPRGRIQSDLTLPWSPRELGADSGGQSGDNQGLSSTESADSESVDELVEEGQAFEAGIVDAIENAPDADKGPIRTREVPEDDVPEEYLDQ